MAGTLLVVQIILAVLIIIVVLLQKSSSIGLGAYSGSNESVFGQKGSGGFLTKMTFALSIAFLVNTLALGYIYNSEHTRSVTDQLAIDRPAPASAIPDGDKAIPTTPVE